MDDNFWKCKREGEPYRWSWMKCIISYYDHQSSVFPESPDLATQPRLECFCLLFNSNAGNHGRQKKKNYYIFFVDGSGLGPPIWKRNLEMTWKFPSFWRWPFVKSHLSRFLGKSIFSIGETQHLSCSTSFVLNCCLLPLSFRANENNCHLQL